MPAYSALRGTAHLSAVLCLIFKACSLLTAWRACCQGRFPCVCPRPDSFLPGLTVQFMCKLVEGSQETLRMAYRLYGWDKLLLCPPVDNARNTVDYLLCLRYYKVVEVQGSNPGPQASAKGAHSQQHPQHTTAAVRCAQSGALLLTTRICVFGDGQATKPWPDEDED